MVNKFVNKSTLFISIFIVLMMSLTAVSALDDSNNGFISNEIADTSSNDLNINSVSSEDTVNHESSSDLAISNKNVNVSDYSNSLNSELGGNSNFENTQSDYSNYGSNSKSDSVSSVSSSDDLDLDGNNNFVEINNSYSNLAIDVNSISLYDSNYEYALFDGISSFSEGFSNSSRNIIYVSPNGNDSNSGNSSDAPKLTIANAIANVNTNGTIYLAAGTYYEYNLELTSYVANGVIFIGENPNNTIIDANKQGRIFNVDILEDEELGGFSPTFINISFVNGSAMNYADSKYGGAIKSSKYINLYNCSFLNNIAERGGAIYITSNLIFTGSVFINNTASYGGAIEANFIQGDFSKFINNSASVNGGACYYKSLNGIANCEFLNNSAKNGNGGVFYQNDTKNHSATLSESIFENNEANNGAIIYSLIGGYYSFDTCTIVNNNASELGGVICFNGEIQVLVSKIINNSAKYGGVVYSVRDSTVYNDDNPVIFYYSHVIGNTAINDGAIAYLGNVSKFYCSNSEFRDNYANLANGSSVYIFNSGNMMANVVLSNSVIYNGNNSCKLFKLNDNVNISSQKVWWGSNAPNFDTLISGNITDDLIKITDWIIMTIKSNPQNISVNENMTVYVSFNNYWNGTDTVISDTLLELPELDVKFLTNMGNFSFVNGKTNGGILNTSYSSSTRGNVTISALTDGETVYLRFEIGKKELVIEIDEITGGPGEIIVISGSLKDKNGNLINESQNVTIKINGTEIANVTSKDGKFEYNWTVPTNYTPGKYNLTIVVDPSENYTGGNGSIILNITESPIILNLDSISAYRGQNITISGNISSKDLLQLNGTVSIKVNGVLIGQAQINGTKYSLNWIVPLSYELGNYNITAEYLFNGTRTFTNSSVLEIVKSPVEINSDSVSAYRGDNVNLTGNITDIVGNLVDEGNVSIFVEGNLIGSSNIVNGKYVINWTVPENISSNASCTIVYSGSKNYENKTINTTVASLINLNKISTSISVNGISAYRGQLINISGSVKDIDNNLVDEGNVSIFVDGVLIDTVRVINGSYKLIWTVPLNFSGNEEFIFNYSGSNKYESSVANSSSNSTMKPIKDIVEVPVSVNITSVIVSDNGTIFVNGSVIAANGENLNGTADIYLDGTLIKNVNVINGTFTHSWVNSSLAIGAHNLTVKYLAEEGYENASADYIFNISKLSTNITISSISVNKNEIVSFVSTIVDKNGNPVNSGEVRVYINGVYVGSSSVVNGKTIFAWNATYDVGNYPIKVVYVANENYTSSEANTTLTINPAKILTHFLGPNNYTFREGNISNVSVIFGTLNNILPGFPVNVIIRDSANNILENRSINVRSDGSVIFVPQLSVGNYTVFYQYAGNETYAPCTFQQTISISPGNRIATTIDLVVRNIGGVNKVSAVLTAAERTKLLAGYELEIVVMDIKTNLIIYNFTSITDSEGCISEVITVNKTARYMTKCTFNGDALYDITWKSVNALLFSR